MDCNPTVCKEKLIAYTFEKTRRKRGMIRNLSR